MRAVLEQGRSLGDCLPPLLEALPPRDRGLAQELAFGTLRWYRRLDALLDTFLRQPLKRKDGDLHALLLLGLYQLLYLDTPPHAAVNETVAAVPASKRWARGLVNGVLRSAQREARARLEALDRESGVRLSHPDWLLETWRRDWGDALAERIAEANNARPPMVLRVNRRRLARDDCLARLAAAGIEARALAEPDAVQLARPQPVTALPGFAEGELSVQDAAAQWAAELLALAPGQRVLDACAAPGGKTAHIAEREPGLAALVALDADAGRLARVRDNLQRLGLEADCIQGDAARPGDWWDGRPFDRILLDAPCSATGVIRRHPDIKWLRRASDIDTLAATQAAMLDALWPLLAPGGMLLYATCSTLRAENDRQVAAFLERTAGARPRPIGQAAEAEVAQGWQLLPGQGSPPGHDGFYYARLERES